MLDRLLDLILALYKTSKENLKDKIRGSIRPKTDVIFYFCPKCSTLSTNNPMA